MNVQQTALFKKKKRFFVWIILKGFIEFVAILLLFFMFWLFGREACGILTFRPGIEPASLAKKDEVLTTGSPGKLPIYFLIKKRKKEMSLGSNASLCEVYLSGRLWQGWGGSAERSDEARV